MKVDWNNLTQAKAKRLLGPAARAVKRAEDDFRKVGEDDAASDRAEQRLLAACELEENLRVFALTGERP